MQIEIDFDVFKALTARRRDETHSYNEVIRELLGLADEKATSLAAAAIDQSVPAKRSFHSRGVVLPHGTQLRAIYKGRTYGAQIDDGRWIDDSGVEHTSPSAAAKDITHNSVNGLRFWQGKRPGDTNWYALDVLAMIG